MSVPLMIPVRVDSWKKARFTKGSVASPIADAKGIQFILNTGSIAFDSDGIGCTSAAATAWAFTMGGPFPNLYMKADLKYVTPTVAGGEDLAIMLHWGSQSQAADRNYLIAQQTGGNFRIRKNVSDTVTTLASVAKVLGQNTWCQIEAYRLRTTFKARIDGGAWLEAEVPESDVPYMGNFGVRTGRSVNSTIKQRLVECEAWM